MFSFLMSSVIFLESSEIFLSLWLVISIIKIVQIEFRFKYNDAFEKRAITDITEFCQIEIENSSFVFIGTSQTHLPRQNRNTTYWTDFVAL